TFRTPVIVPATTLIVLWRLVIVLTLVNGFRYLSIDRPLDFLLDRTRRIRTLVITPRKIATFDLLLPVFPPVVSIISWHSEAATDSHRLILQSQLSELATNLEPVLGEHRLQVDRFPIRDKPSLEDWSLNVKVSVMIGLGEVQLSPTYYHNSCRSHRSLRLPSHNIVTPACTTTFIFPSSTLQITLALVAPLLRLLLVIFDCLRKLMLVIISMEPKTVTMSLLCTVVALSAQSNEYSRTGVYGSTLLDQASFMECIPFLPAMPADAPQHFIRVLGMHRSPTSVVILGSFVRHIVIKRKPLITSVGVLYQPFPNPLDRAPHRQFISRLQYVLGNISFGVSSEAFLRFSFVI
ncbi:hypothetical protein HID58_049074, partial [Brassica napus]